MFYKYIKLSKTKDIKDYSNLKCIVISQNIIDFSIARMILKKKIKIIINCVDHITETSSMEMLFQRGIRIYHLPILSFMEFNDNGVLYVNGEDICYLNRAYKIMPPKKIPLDDCIESFIENTILYMEKEKTYIDKIDIKGVFIKPRENVLIISRGTHGKGDINAVKGIIKKYNPTIICVDGGADIAMENGIHPDMIIGDMDSISLRAIKKNDYYILHTYTDGRCPGNERIPKTKKKAYLSCIGTSEDAALLFCIKNDVKKIFTLGYRITAKECIEKGRKGMSASLIIRMKYGDIIYDIKNTTDFTKNIEGALLKAGMVAVIIYICLVITKVMEVFK